MLARTCPLHQYHIDARRAFQYAVRTVEREGPPYVPLTERFPGVEPALIELVLKMLRLNRYAIPTTSELLQDKYFDDMDRSTIKSGPSASYVRSMLKVRGCDE
jgi:hypothetical protein